MQMKSLSEIAVSLIVHIHDALPEVDTKEGTFIRDVFINPVSTEVADIYKELKLLELAQSITTAQGSDLDKLAGNFFIKRKDATYATGKIRFYIGVSAPESDIFVPRGAIIGSPGDSNTEPMDYITNESIDIVAGDISTFQRDQINGQYYVDVDAMALEPGAQYNAYPNTITLPGDVVDTEIVSVTNPLPFTNGSDEETDLSLMMRVSMAITGVNIGTKDGYRSFLMKQSGVDDAIIVGAGDPLMERDKGEGGMVDIYVRIESAEEHSFIHTVTNEYVNAGYPNLQFPENQRPVLMVEKIIGRTPDASQPTGYVEKTYINATNYKIENGTSKYYRDIKWDFNLSQTDGLDTDELLKSQAINILSAKLKDEKNKLLDNIKYDIDWQLIDPYLDTDIMFQNDDFYRGKYNGKIYLIASKDDISNPFVGGRNFISRDGEIYERIYVEPDFEIDRDLTHNAKSVFAKDSIKWIPNILNDNLPKAGESLFISYSWNSGIASLQQSLDEKRILTADVLLKQSTGVPIEIKINVVPEVGYNASTIRSAIVNNVSSYINDIKKLGGSIDRSDLVYIARGTEGVEAVDLNNVHLSKLDDMPEQVIELKGFEFMTLESIYIRVLPAKTIV